MQSFPKLRLLGDVSLDLDVISLEDELHEVEYEVKDGEAPQILG